MLFYGEPENIFCCYFRVARLETNREGKLTTVANGLRRTIRLPEYLRTLVCVERQLEQEQLTVGWEN